MERQISVNKGVEGQASEGSKRQISENKGVEVQISVNRGGKGQVSEDGEGKINVNKGVERQAREGVEGQISGSKGVEGHASESADGQASGNEVVEGQDSKGVEVQASEVVEAQISGNEVVEGQASEVVEGGEHGAPIAQLELASCEAKLSEPCANVGKHSFQMNSVHSLWNEAQTTEEYAFAIQPGPGTSLPVCTQFQSSQAVPSSNHQHDIADSFLSDVV